METVVIVLPILPGKEEAWRRFCQNLAGSRRCHYDAFRRRIGFQDVQIWTLDTSPFQAIVIHISVEQPAAAVERLAASGHPFDLWFKRHVLDLHGLDLQRLPAALYEPPELRR